MSGLGFKGLGFKGLGFKGLREKGLGFRVVSPVRLIGFGASG